MGRIAKRSVVAMLVAALILVPVSAMAQSSSYSDPFLDDEQEIGAGAMLVDLVIVRPLSLIGLAVGTAGFVVSLPFSIRNTEDAAQKLVTDPLLYTFDRPLGDFDRH